MNAAAGDDANAAEAQPMLSQPGLVCRFRLILTIIEFWQEAPDGLHDRIRYCRAADSWKFEPLALT